MAILGFILLLFWFFVPPMHITLVLVIALILLVVGLVLWFRPVGGRRVY